MKQRLCVCGSPNPQTLGTFRFSQPLGAFIRPMSAGLISCQIRTWGSPLQSFFPPRRCQPSPAASPSCRYASNQASSQNKSQTKRCKHRVTSQALHMTKPSETPSTSGYCSTRRSDTLLRRFRPKQSRCSPEALAPPRYSPSPAVPKLSPRQPLM